MMIITENRKEEAKSWLSHPVGTWLLLLLPISTKKVGRIRLQVRITDTVI